MCAGILYPPLAVTRGAVCLPATVALGTGDFAGRTATTIPAYLLFIAFALGTNLCAHVIPPNKKLRIEYASYSI